MRIAEMAATQRLPTLVPNALSDAGGLIGYGTDLTEAVRRIAIYVDKIRKGANPADLPFEVFVRPELIVNLTTARAIGIAIPPDVLKRANRSFNKNGLNIASRFQWRRPARSRRHNIREWPLDLRAAGTLRASQMTV
jgi:hypothetical protein